MRRAPFIFPGVLISYNLYYLIGNVCIVSSVLTFVGEGEEDEVEGDAVEKAAKGPRENMTPPVFRAHACFVLICFIVLLLAVVCKFQFRVACFGVSAHLIINS